VSADASSRRSRRPATDAALAGAGVAAALAALLGWTSLLAGAHRAWKEAAGRGLAVTYYRDAEFRRPVCRRLEPRVSVDYGEGRPAWRVPSRGFAARWEGVLLAPAGATYQFYLQSVGGSRLYLDDRLVIDHSASRRWKPGRGGEAELAAGPHRIRIEHADAPGAAALEVRWTGGGIPANTVLAAPFVGRPRPAAPGPPASASPATGRSTQFKDGR
jgi:hypothetical protein